MDSASFVSLDLMLSEVAKRSGDPSFRHESEGYYKSLIREALNELSFDTYFYKEEKVYDLSDGCLKLELPAGAFNVREIYGFSGDSCTPSNSTNIYYKRNFSNGLSKDTWGNRNDPFHKNRGSQMPPGWLYYCGIVNGVIHLSSNCANFEKIAVRFNGVLGDVDGAPIIPMFFRQAVIDYVIVEALSIRIANTTDFQKVNIWQSILNRHEARMNKPYTGSWDNARHRSKTMNKKAREDYKEYFARLDY